MLLAPQRRSPVARLSPGFIRRRRRTRRVRRLTLTKPYEGVLAPPNDVRCARCVATHRPLRRRASSPSHRGRDACRATTRHGVKRRYHTPGRFVTSRSRARSHRIIAPRTASRPLSLISGFAKLVTGAVPAAARPHPPPQPGGAAVPPPERRRPARTTHAPRTSARNKLPTPRRTRMPRHARACRRFAPPIPTLPPSPSTAAARPTPRDSGPARPAGSRSSAARRRAPRGVPPRTSAPPP